MTDIFRALCFELESHLSALSWITLDIASKDEAEHDLAHAIAELCSRARTALAQPEPPPELTVWSAINVMADRIASLETAVSNACAALAQPERAGPTKPRLWSLLARDRPPIGALCDYVVVTDCGTAQGQGRWCEQMEPECAGFTGNYPPVGPTDEEIMELMPQQMHEDLAAAVRALAEQAGTISRSATGIMRIMLNRHVVDLARAVLQRWGRPAITPIPVSERLPGPEDCDAEGRCWWGDAGNDQFVPSWRLCERPNPPHFTRWLPAHALPLPSNSTP